MKTKMIILVLKPELLNLNLKTRYILAYDKTADIDESGSRIFLRSIFALLIIIATLDAEVMWNIF